MANIQLFALIVLSSAALLSAACPPGLSEVQCFVDPCETHTCPNHPLAVCKRNTCGGCFAEFYVGEIRVDDSCGSTVQEPPQSSEESKEVEEECPPGVSRVGCFVDPCETVSCPKNPNAVCKANFCGGCFAQFFENGRRVDDTCGKLTPDRSPEANVQRCPPGKRVVNCFVNPCKVKRCPQYPNARCEPDYCDGCNTKFYKANGDRLWDSDCVEIEGEEGLEDRVRSYFAGWGK